MNYLSKSLNVLANSFLRPNSNRFNLPGLVNMCRPSNYLFQGVSFKNTLFGLHARGPRYKNTRKIRPLDGNPFMKGIVIRNVVKKPKKPNSANRKCVLVRLSNGKEKLAYVPGIGHNLQEHNVVLCRVGRLKDCVGVKLKCVRGKYDLSHVVKQKI